MNEGIGRVVGEPYLKLCTYVCGYWRGSCLDHREAITNFHAASVRAVGARLRWYETETMGKRRPLTPDILTLIDFWLSDERAQRQFMSLELEGGEDPDLPSDAAFVFKSIQSETLHAGVCRVVVPVHIGLSEPDRLLNLAKDLLSPTGFVYGTSGFAVHWNPRSPVARLAKQKFPYLAKRYWGIDIPLLTGTLLTVPRGIKSIDWLTMLSDDLWKPVEAEYGSRLGVDGAVRVHVLPGGVMIQAGPTPRIGDSYGHDPIDDYQAVGEALAPLRAHDHPAIIPGADEETAESRTEEWLARFEGKW